MTSETTAGPPSTTDTSTTLPSTTTTSTTAAPSTTTTTSPVVLPPTFVGVTEDYEAVEVDTATGAVIRSLGQVSTAEDVATAECAACVNAVDAVWRTADGEHFIISECCEPAAGQIHLLTETELPLTLETADTPLFFWAAAPSPVSDEIAFVGYSVLVTRPDGTPAHESDMLARLPISNPSWDPAGRLVRWLEGDDGGVHLRTLDVRLGTASEVPVPDATAWHGVTLATSGSGEMLVVVPSLEEGAAATGAVLNPDGAITDLFGLEPGARLGGYDPGGTFLIYTADDGVVRFLGEGGGVLADGFIFASW